MLELQLLTNLMEMINHIHGNKFEYGGNLYSVAAVRARHKELFSEFIEPYMVAQNVEVVDITEKSE